MKIELKLTSDSYNTYCDDKILTIEFLDFEGSEKNVWFTLGDREIAVDKNEFKKAVSII